MEKITTASTSLHSAQVGQQFELWKTDTRRLIFLAELVDNPYDPAACVRGHLVYQRKNKDDEWEDLSNGGLNTLKSGEGVKFEFKSKPMLTFYSALSDLYALYEEHGITPGTATFLRATKQMEAIAQLKDADLARIVAADSSLGATLLRKLLKWAAGLSDAATIVNHLETADPADLQNLAAITGIATLKKALTIWQNNQENSSEEFWQKQLVQHQFLLEHLFTYPITVVKDKAYIGGKSLDNTGGNLVDFLLKNKLTHNVVLLEIKTPTSRLLGSEYRKGIYNASSDLTGSVLQVLDYRASFTQECLNLQAKSGTALDASDPPCYVIIGKTAELDTPSKRKSFELFRRQFPGVGISTYDEMFGRAKTLLKLLRAP